MIAPPTLLIVGIIGSIGTIATFTAYTMARKAGPKLTMDDFRPCLPWEGLPLPRFVYTKPELREELWRS
ncbi:hypothetical protein ES708_03662 [subsurface metagenome]